MANSGLIMQDSLGGSYVRIYDEGAAELIFFRANADNAAILLSGNGYTYFGDGADGKPKINHFANNLSNISYSFVSDENTGMYRIGADDLGFATGGTKRLELTTSAITSTLPLVVTGSTTYIQVPTLTGTERDALTPSNGMIIYNSTASRMQYYAGATWNNF